MSINYTPLPTHLQAEAQAYVEHGTRPGELLMAVLDNQLRQALDAMPSGLDAETECALLCALVTWARVEAPCISRGAVEITNAWMTSGGLQGRAAARQAAEAAHKARESARAHELSGQRYLRVVGTAATRDDGLPLNAYSFAHMADTVARFGALAPR